MDKTRNMQSLCQIQIMLQISNKIFAQNERRFYDEVAGLHLPRKDSLFCLLKYKNIKNSLQSNLDVPLMEEVRKMKSKMEMALDK